VDHRRDDRYQEGRYQTARDQEDNQNGQPAPRCGTTAWLSAATS
jgi:hypothetical protein